MQIHRHKTKQSINKSPTIQSQKNLKQKAPSRDRNTHTQEAAHTICFSMTIPCLTSAERLKCPKSQPSSLLQVTPTGSPFSSGTRQRKSWWETLTDMTRSHLCGMFFLVVTATTEGTEAESSREVGATGWTRVLGPQRGPGSALGSPTSLQASPGPVCKVGTLSLHSGGSFPSTTV